MPSSFNIALSALNAHTTALDVVGNNLANLNTTGFKGSSVSFHDLVSQSMATRAGANDIGAGLGPTQAVRQFGQGSIQTTGGALNAAIQGDGFFITRDTRGNTLYTRSGDFRLDQNGNLLSSAGNRVQGWTATNGVVNSNGTVGNITLPSGTLGAPVATTQMSLNLNLNANAPADATSAFSTPIEVVDSLGAKHTLTVTFTKTGANAWGYDVTIPGSEVTGGSATTPTSVAKGALTFDSNGNLTSPAVANGVINLQISGLANGAANMATAWSLYGTGGAARLTQVTDASALSSSNQNGVAPATLVSVGLADGGRIIGKYSNGQQLTVAQLALASIQNPDTLHGVGDSEFSVTTTTATPVVGIPETGGRGSVIGGALEASTVDIAREFTNLIVYQRGYQANSRVITTTDEIMQDTLNLKR